MKHFVVVATVWAMGLAFGLTSVVLPAGSATAAAVAQPAFADVAPGAAFYDDIQWLYEQGITRGSPQPDGTVLFQPAAPVRREAMAAFLYRFAASPAFTPPVTSPFVDVPTTGPFYKEIAWLAASGISKGTDVGNGTFEFRPAESVTREAMAAFLYRYKGKPAFTAPAVSPFVDVPTTSPFYKEIAWLAANAISKGTDVGNGTFEFRPAESVSREAMAAFLHRTSALTVTTAPGPVTNVTATSSNTSIVLSWTNPTAASFTGVMIRRALGATPPATATAGTLVVDAAKPATSYTNTGLTSGTQYSYALFAHDGTPVYAAAATVTSTTTAVLTPVTGVSAVPASTSIALSWTNPTGASFTGVMIRRALGATPPATATAGTLVTDAAKPATSYTNTGLTTGTQYSYALFAHDGTPVYAAAATVTSTTTTAGGAISGTVTDAVGTGLANVWVHMFSPTTAANGDAHTAADGSYTVTHLAAGWDYKVCFYADGATGGSSDALGYIDQCTTLVGVSSGATTTGINAALVGGGAVSGTVTDAGGTPHGLAGVEVLVQSASTGAYRWPTTAADGSYTATGLPAATDYTVRFYASGATGGASDATGYLDQWYNNQPTSDTATPVTVTLGATRTGINAALIGKP